MSRAARLRPALSHEAASLLAQLALRSTIPAPELETLRELLSRVPASRILAALDQATLDLANAGGPDWPRTRADQESYLLLLDGLRALTQVEHTYLPLAA